MNRNCISAIQSSRPMSPLGGVNASPRCPTRSESQLRRTGSVKFSRSTRTCDLTEKREVFAEYGVGWLWFVDPAALTLGGFALGVLWAD